MYRRKAKTLARKKAVMAKKKIAKKAAKKAATKRPTKPQSQFLVMARFSRDDIPLGLFGSKITAHRFVGGLTADAANDATDDVCERLGRTMLSQRAAGVSVSVVESAGGVPARAIYERELAET